MYRKFSLEQFHQRYGTEYLCTETLRQLRYPDRSECPKCHKISAYYQVTNRRAFACKLCGGHIYPSAGTIFEKSIIPLRLWFFAVYLLVQTKAEISITQLQHTLGVTYKTAWRMFKKIAWLMAKEPSILGGITGISVYSHQPEQSFLKSLENLFANQPDLLRQASSLSADQPPFSSLLSLFC